MYAVENVSGVRRRARAYWTEQINHHVLFYYSNETKQLIDHSIISLKLTFGFVFDVIFFCLPWFSSLFFLLFIFVRIGLQIFLRYLPNADEAVLFFFSLLMAGRLMEWFKKDRHTKPIHTVPCQTISSTDEQLKTI